MVIEEQFLSSHRLPNVSAQAGVRSLIAFARFQARGAKRLRPEETPRIIDI